MRLKKERPGPKKARKTRKQKFSARLLFQFRTVSNGRNDIRRLCEDRIIAFRSQTAKQALRYANAHGKAAQYSYRGSLGAKVYFEFVGVTDLIEIGVECAPDEVWYDFFERVRPMERRKKLIPAAAKLNAIEWERFVGAKRNRTRSKVKKAR